MRVFLYFQFIILRMPDTENRSQKSKNARLIGLVFLLVVLLWIWLSNTPEGILGKADATAYAVCHRIENRSFTLGDRAFPLCIRCSGMYLGALLGLIYMTILQPRRGGVPKPWVLAVLAGFALAFVLDGVNSFLDLINNELSFYPPQHIVRMLTGMGMGLVLSVLVYVGFNQTIWKEWDARPVLDSWRSFLGLMGLALLLVILVWIQNPLILYPLALISVAGVWTVLTLVYTMIWLLFTRRDNLFTEPRQLVIPLLAGFGTALLQIMVFDLVRFILTGTWSGFQFG